MGLLLPRGPRPLVVSQPLRNSKAMATTSPWEVAKPWLTATMIADGTPNRRLFCRFHKIRKLNLFGAHRLLRLLSLRSTLIMGEAQQAASASGDAKEFVIVQEGKAKVGFHGPVFYNPVQEFNRDLTVSVLREFVRTRAANNVEAQNGGDEPKAKKSKLLYDKEDGSIRILDALSASGLRALRFSQEVENVDFVLANDFSENAVESIKENIVLNGVEAKVRANFGDAIVTMMEHRSIDKRFHAVDLDPYGSASVFLDSAVQCVADQGRTIDGHMHGYGSSMRKYA
ncbi:hypothetical protein Q1695_003950 [Nippostrongylus brasiliensis]|nr:hypothetical protein Q1695_003950 [Nippostrongylus brasiliensis]